MSYLIKKDQLVFRQANELQTLAREVYNRIPPAPSKEGPAALPINTGWSIQLAEALPRKIAFETKADTPFNVMYDNSQLHVAYSISQSGHWVSAAFTDNSGKYQCNASYFMPGTGTFDKVAEEIWSTCIDIMKPRKVNWRLCIAKVGQMMVDELNGTFFSSSLLIY
jgi:mediator of RNA polymerase II transcription subunit 13